MYLLNSSGASMGTICVGGDAVDLEAAAAENQEFLSTRTSQRSEMVVLNDRLAAYIEKESGFQPCFLLHYICYCCTPIPPPKKKYHRGILRFRILLEPDRAPKDPYSQILNTIAYLILLESTHVF